jgi:hypothetical protein
MIDKSTNYFDGVAKDLGLSIKIPRPGIELKRISSVTNGVVGLSLLLGGIAVSSKILVGLGVLGLAGAFILAIDEKDAQHD